MHGDVHFFDIIGQRHGFANKRKCLLNMGLQILHIFKDDRFFHRINVFTFDNNESYPDGGTSATIFTCTNFTELECLSPEKALKIGETLEFDIRWKLNKLKPGSQANLREQASKWLNNNLSNIE